MPPGDDGSGGDDDGGGSGNDDGDDVETDRATVAYMCMWTVNVRS